MSRISRTAQGRTAQGRTEQGTDGRRRSAVLGATAAAGLALVLPLAAPAQAATINGTNGADLLVGTNGHDTIRGLGGHDRIRARAGHDVVRAGSGNDRVNAGPGNDDVRGDAGNDRVEGGPGVDQLRGGDGDDVITDSSRFRTNGENGTYVGGNGNDRIVADGDLYGGRGNDRLRGDGYLSGGPGKDRIRVTGPHSYVSTGTGTTVVTTTDDDQMVLVEGTGDQVTTGAGNDAIEALETTRASQVSTGAGKDSVSTYGAAVGTLDTGAGDDTVLVDLTYTLSPGARITCGAGEDTVDLIHWARGLSQIDASCENVRLVLADGRVVRNLR